MKNKTHILFPFLLLISCTQQQAPLPAEQKIIITQEVKQTLNNYYTDIQKNGLTAEFNYLDSSADFFWVPPGYTSAISYDSVAKVLRQNAPHYTSIVNTFDTLTIFIITKELATYT